MPGRLCAAVRGVTKGLASLTIWKGGPQRVKAPWAKAKSSPPAAFPSRAGHVESGLNPGGPPPKAKYYLATDSEIVARANGEKNPCKGSEKYLKPCTYTAVGARYPRTGRSTGRTPLGSG